MTTTDRAERERIALAKAQQLAAASALQDQDNAAGIQALQHSLREHLLTRAKLTGASADRIAQLEALRGPDPATQQAGNVPIDPTTMTPRKDA